MKILETTRARRSGTLDRRDPSTWVLAATTLALAGGVECTAAMGGAYLPVAMLQTVPLGQDQATKQQTANAQQEAAIEKARQAIDAENARQQAEAQAKAEAGERAGLEAIAKGQAEARAKAEEQARNEAQAQEEARAAEEWAKTHPKEARLAAQKERRERIEEEQRRLSGELCIAYQAERGHREKIRELNSDSRIAGVISLTSLHYEQTWVVLWRRAERAYLNDLRDLPARPIPCRGTGALRGEQLGLLDEGEMTHNPKDFVTPTDLGGM